MFKALLFITVFALLANNVYSQTLCEKYGNATKTPSHLLLIGSVVTDAVTSILADGGLRKFFDGSYTVSTNFSDTTSPAFGALATKLVSFFGTALGCSDGSIPMYQGNVTTVHLSMNISYSEYNKFNFLVVQTLKAKGFEDADASAVAGVLNGPSLRAICTSSDMSCGMLCNRYSVPWNLNNSALVSTVVNKTVMAALGSDVLKPFFDGTTPAGSTNFTDPKNSGAFMNLFNHLVQFFGGALGCSDKSIPMYQGNANLTQVHKNMPINKLAFETFNNALVAQMKSLGVAQADLDAVASVLASTKVAICNQPDCFTSGSSMMGSSAMGSSMMGSSMMGSSMMGSSAMGSSMMGSSAMKSSTTSTPSTTGNAYTLIFSVVALFVTLLI